MWTQPVKADSASLMVALDSLQRTPKGAKYTARSGRAAVSVQMRDRIVYVDATCDSLEQLVYYYHMQNAQLQQEAKKQELNARQATTRAERIEQRTKTRSLAAALMVMFGVLASILVMIKTASPPTNPLRFPRSRGTETPRGRGVK